MLPTRAPVQAIALALFVRTLPLHSPSNQHKHRLGPRTDLPESKRATVKYPVCVYRRRERMRIFSICHSRSTHPISIFATAYLSFKREKKKNRSEQKKRYAAVRCFLRRPSHRDGNEPSCWTLTRATVEGNNKCLFYAFENCEEDDRRSREQNKNNK